MSDLLAQNLGSPRKIRRLESYSQKTVDVGKIRGSQESQQSCATSTPTKQDKGKNFDISLDLSSIHSAPAAPSEKSFLTESVLDEEDDDDVVSSTASILTELSIKETSQLYSHSSIGDRINLKKPDGKLFKGKLWNFFKPKNEGSLYFKIFTNLDCITECASDFLKEFQSNRRNVILSLIKFFVDVCGYQTLEIDKHFNFNVDSNISCKKVIKLMEFDLVDPELLENKTYIFYESSKGKSKLSVTLAAAIQQFLNTFFSGIHSMNELFSDVIYKYLFNFLYHMCQSTLRPIKHTGVVLVGMLLNILNRIFDELLKEVDSENDSESNAEKKARYMVRYLEYFFGVYAKNSFVPDSNLSFLRAEIVREMGRWIVDHPHFYFEKCFEYLLKLLIDESEVVRLNTLKVFERFVSRCLSALDS